MFQPKRPRADVVERRAETRQHERRIGHGRQGRDHAHFPGGGADQRGQRRRIHLRAHEGVFQIGLGAAAVGVGDHQRVFEHDVVEAGALHRLRHVDVEFAVPGIAVSGERLVPIVDRGGHEPAEVEFLWCHCLLPSAFTEVLRTLIGGALALSGHRLHRDNRAGDREKPSGMPQASTAAFADFALGRPLKKEAVAGRWR